MTDSERQLTRADLDTMSPAEIVKASRDGRLDDLKRGIDGGTPVEPYE